MNVSTVAALPTDGLDAVVLTVAAETPVPEPYRGLVETATASFGELPFMATGPPCPPPP